MMQRDKNGWSVMPHPFKSATVLKILKGKNDAGRFVAHRLH
jgi:hypothetical protein